MKFCRLEVCNGMAALILLWTAAGCASTPRPVSHDADIEGVMEDGNASMRNGDYESAVSFYRRAGDHDGF